MNLLEETKIEKTQLMTKKITIEYNEGIGYKMTRFIDHHKTLDEAWQNNVRSYYVRLILLDISSYLLFFLWQILFYFFLHMIFIDDIWQK